MPWLKMLHMSAVIVWCGTLLYLPLLVRFTADSTPASRYSLQGQWPRKVFIGVSTPAALLAIGSGTLLFVFNGLIAPWLMFKLLGVSLLVLGHGTCAVLLLRVEADHLGECGICRWLAYSMPIVLLAIAWLVLRKPP